MKCNIVKSGGWIYYYGDCNSLSKFKCGKWMYFFSDRSFVSDLCFRAVNEQVVIESKHTDAEDGVACFYLNVDDINAHKRVLNFFLENKLIRISNKTGKYYNISFKRDTDTHTGHYAVRGNYHSEIKLDRFIDLKTGQWIMNEYELKKLLPLEVKLISETEDFRIDKKLYGKDSAYEYIFLAFPNHVPVPSPLKIGKMHFWEGNIPDFVLNQHLLFLVTFKAEFSLKLGKTPFVKCKTSLLYPNKPLETSDIYNRQDGKYYKEYRDLNGNVVRAFPSFTLIREDFEYFKETYDIDNLEIIGGCYFQ